MTMQRRLLLSSKKREEVQFRKSVADCYCNRQTRKMQFRSNRTKVAKPTACKHCKSFTDLRPMAWVESNDSQSRAILTPISCETVRRVRKINYSPQSEFLQKKVSSTQNLFDDKLQALPKYVSPSLEAGDAAQNHSKPIHSFCRNIQSESNNEINFHNSIDVCKKSHSHQSEESEINSKKSLREKLIKRTISSKKTLCTSESVQLQKTKNCNFTSKDRNQSSQSNIKNWNHEKFDYDNFSECNFYLKHRNAFSDKVSQDKLINHRENPLSKVYKFREQNYFDTHGSTHTLLSSGSSGSLEKYILNERLFPQPVGKVHRGDLVVTMPSCSAMENKKIHYFPRFIVKQERNQSMNAKKKYTCPLTGHLTNVKTIKTQHPSNSLALKFQKGVI
ncbi:uncharacterized protein LOC122502346 [Leptopilina heterotoma]|uniref:uncharacterized protein LOC122502346 n=1 Tax=Leptopilina heterotoma TaxID=63436 RepID=UPI001CA8B63B|nr:uncharacterized protein LOC122502346 [Leptopilina heterotoma]